MIHYKKFTALLAALILLFTFIGPVWGQEIEKININKASAEELARLQTVGPKHAVRIIEHRKKYGPYKLTEELMEIPGIGPSTYDRIKDHIFVE
jgi:competence protein ComEA